MPGHLCSECGRMQDENGFCQAGCPNSAEQLDEDEYCPDCGEYLEEGICPDCDFEDEEEEEDNYNEDTV